MKLSKVMLTPIFCCVLILGGVACGAGAAPTTTLAPTTTSVPATTTTLAPVEQEHLLVGTMTWDLDTNTDGVAGADVWYEQATSRERKLVPKNGATMAVIQGKAFDEVTYEDLASADLSADPISVSDKNPAIDVGSVLAVFTNGAAYAKMEVLGFESKRVSGRTIKKFSIRFHYVLYR